MFREKLLTAASPNTPERFSRACRRGMVKNSDPQGNPSKTMLGEVMVRYPGLAKDLEGVWAPCCSARWPVTKSGFWALPAEGDSRCSSPSRRGNFRESPFVLGALWTVKRPPPADNINGTNSKRML